MLRLLLICWLAVLALPASAQERHALVVGIDAYQELPVLKKAVNDARAMAAVLERAGFRVDAGYDLNRRDFVRLLARFVDRLQPEDEALVFYAGHAVEIGRRNYLVPADATDVQQSNEAQIIAESIGQNFLLTQVAARNVRLSVVILDACRDNPFEGLVTRGVSASQGLAIETPPRGVFLMYSADEGQKALDGLGPSDPHPNSIFTRTLLPLLEEPGLDIVEIARRVREEVAPLAASVGHAQDPEYRDRMRGRGRFVLTPPAMPTSLPLSTSIAEPAAAPDPCASARADWAVIEATDNRAILEAYIDAHPACAVQLALARERLEALAPASVVLPEGAPDTGPAPASDPVPEIASLAPTATPAPASSSAVILREAIIGNLASSAFSPDLRRVALGTSDSLVTVHDTHTGALLYEFAPDQRWAGDILRLAFHPEGRQLAAAREDGRLTVWDLDTGVAVLEQDLGESALNSVAFSSDGSALLLGLRPALMVALDIGTGEEIRSVGFDLGFGVEAVLRFEETPDGTGYAKLATSDRGQRWVGVRLGSFLSGGGSGGKVSTCSFFNRRPEDFALSPDGRTHALAGPEGVHLCDNASNQAFFRFAIERGARHVRFDETGRRLAALDWNGNLHLFEIDGPDTRHVLKKVIGRISNGAFSSDVFLATLQEEDRSVRLIRTSLVDSAALSSTQSFSQNSHAP